jgi:segregation and condensation protein B
VGQDPETTATLYGTTEALLRHLGIDDISELPPIAPLLDDPSEGFEHESL